MYIFRTVMICYGSLLVEVEFVVGKNVSVFALAVVLVSVLSRISEMLRGKVVELLLRNLYIE